MKERPILFSAPMVRAILNGSKTQTRRAVKLGKLTPLSVAYRNAIRRFSWCNKVGEGVAMDESDFLHLCPYGQPSDRLWVRETWAPEQIDADAMSMQEVSDSVCMPAYRADFSGSPAYRWHPSIHMPRWASRILLEVISVRVERLKEISHQDAMAEGMAWDDAVYDYSRLWESINGAGSWDTNPWVWVVEFKRRPYA